MTVARAGAAGGVLVPTSGFRPQRDKKLNLVNFNILTFVVSQPQTAKRFIRILRFTGQVIVRIKKKIVHTVLAFV